MLLMSANLPLTPAIKISVLLISTAVQTCIHGDIVWHVICTPTLIQCSHVQVQHFREVNMAVSLTKMCVINILFRFNFFLVY